MLEKGDVPRPRGTTINKANSIYARGLYNSLYCYELKIFAGCCNDDGCIYYCACGAGK